MSVLEKAIEILNYLSNADTNLKITELSTQLSIPKSTVHRILSTLLKYSLVSKDPMNSRYGLGIQMLRYSNSFYNSFDFRKYSKDILKKVSITTGLTTFLSIWQLNKGVCIDSERCSNESNTLNLFVEVGKIMPSHCAASSKILLAYQPKEEISRLIKKEDLKKYTPKTITDPQKLIEHLKEIRIQGFAVCDEELEDGVRAISAPIKNLNGRVVASITVVGLSKKVPIKKNSTLIKLVVEAGKEISHLIGYES
ncbi:MAG: IclR family transcriptional regulator [Candidatus Caldatribacteriota bacterium]